ncbi:hypothetical protein, partial [Aerobium aerolatum]|uniref:hypothetical protein n=1 Tax=Aerobium aerolatum TaxID=561088 RepID=UPI001AECA520
GHVRFQLFRLILNETRDLFSSSDSRETWLRRVFSEPFVFQHKKLYHYVPVGFELSDQTEYQMGKVARERTVRDHLPPSEDLEPFERASWDVAHIVIDPQHHDDGQKFGFEISSLGDPLALLRSMTAHINTLPHAPFHIAGNPISKIQSFVDFLERHPENISFIQFDLNAPNMFGDRTNVDAEMKVARDKYRAKRARVVLANDEGMSLDHQRIREMAEYATTGGGEIKAKTLDKASFHSREGVQEVYIPTDGDIDKRELLWLLINALFRK